MELNLVDAIRLHRLIEFDAEGERLLVEPHGLSALDGGSSLRAFVLEGPRLGWNQFQGLEQSQRHPEQLPAS